MVIEELQELRDQIQALIRRNHSLRRETETYAERLLMRERQIRELRERCKKFEKDQKEAYQRISAILDRFETIRL